MKHNQPLLLIRLLLCSAFSTSSVVESWLCRRFLLFGVVVDDTRGQKVSMLLFTLANTHTHTHTQTQTHVLPSA